MAINKFISIKQSLADLRDEIGADSTLDTPKINRYVTRCLAKLTGKRMLEPFICVLNFEHQILNLPINAVLLEGMIWGDHGTECWNLFERYKTYPDSLGVVMYNILIGDLNANDTISVSNNNFHIINNVMRFNQDFGERSITVKFWGYKEDCGSIMYPEYCNDAVLSYIKMKLAEESQWRPKAYRITATMYKEYQGQWDHDYRAVHGDMNEPNEAERDEGAAMVGNPLSGSVENCWSIYPF